MAKKKENYQWERVVGTPPTTDNQKRFENNQKVLKNKLFLDTCSNLNIEPTKRQASKYNNKKGIVYKTINHII